MVWLFSLTLGLSAVLLFWVQPMFARMVLPLLGGVPAVWNVAMVFFQAALLAGYLYSHLGDRYLRPRVHAMVHMPLSLLPLLALPIAVASGWQPPADGAPALWLLALLTVSVGLPFFLVATTAPLLQRWFAVTGHRDAHNPYFLYSASNIGSIAALLAYPLIMEPLLRLEQQSHLWTAGYVLLIAGIALCGWTVLKRPVAAVSVATVSDTSGEERPSWRLMLHWGALAFVPSGLLLGVTQHLTTDVVAVPLFWVAPLVLYLLTYVIVFARRPPLRHAWMVKLQPFLLILLAVTLYWQVNALWFTLPLHLAAFFVSAMVCHGELAAHRPVVEHEAGHSLEQLAEEQYAGRELSHCWPEQRRSGSGAFARRAEYRTGRRGGVLRRRVGRVIGQRSISREREQQPGRRPHPDGDGAAERGGRRSWHPF